MDRSPPAFSGALPPNQQLVAPGRWPVVGERTPAPGPEEWTLRISGRVAAPGCWTLTELQQLAACEQLVDIHCVTRWSKLQVSFRGLPLMQLVDRAQPLADAHFVVMRARSDRGHSSSLPLTFVRGASPLLAWDAEGQPLLSEHGGPLRVVVPGRYFYKSVKWVETLELTQQDQLGYWESQAGYHNEADPWREQRYLASNLSRSQIARLLATRDFRQQELRGLRAADQELDGLRAEGAILRDADFRRCRLRAARFQQANLSNAHLQEADLREANFAQADVEGANFAGADLRGADFRGASLFGATFFIPGSDANANAAARVDAKTNFDAGAEHALTPIQAEFLQHARQARG